MPLYIPFSLYFVYTTGLLTGGGRELLTVSSLITADDKKLRILQRAAADDAKVLRALRFIIKLAAAVQRFNQAARAC